MELTVVVHSERGEFWSEVCELPGCFASGGTLEELHEALAESIGLYLWDDPVVEVSPATLTVGEARIEVPEPSWSRPDR